LSLEGSLSRESNSLNPVGPISNNGSLNITLTVPLFQGGAMLAQTRQKIALQSSSAHALAATKSRIEAKVRSAFGNVNARRNQIKALQQVVLSNKSALTATETAFKGGTRNIVDVLNAQSRLLRAERDYSLAKHNFLIQQLELKLASGIINKQDLVTIAKYQLPTSSQ